MPQSLSAVYIHLVFSTKNRTAFLHDLALRDELHAFLGGISKSLQCPPVRIGGVEDHVHLVARIGRTISQSDWVKELKRVSSAWVKEHPQGTGQSAWQRGYADFSVSRSNLDEVVAYVADQPRHHAKRSFQDELRALFRKHEIEWDERYVWD